jgi:DNA-binding PadR family transcriptional regulator
MKTLSEPVFLILTSLAASPKHGYALLKDIEELSGGTVRLSTGTLYGAVRRLLEDEWIATYVQEDVSRDKQAYQLTSIGRKHLELHVARMQELTRKAAARLKSRKV